MVAVHRCNAAGLGTGALRRVFHPVVHPDALDGPEARVTVRKLGLGYQPPLRIEAHFIGELRAQSFEGRALVRCIVEYFSSTVRATAGDLEIRCEAEA